MLTLVDPKQVEISVYRINLSLFDEIAKESLASKLDTELGIQ